MGRELTRTRKWKQGRTAVDFWQALGFRTNPYVVRPLPASQEGRDLLVGRDAELSRLLTKIRSSDLHPVLEGPNGVGKTSLVSVAAWVARQEYCAGTSPRLYLPLGDALQIGDDADAFIADCYYAIAQAFVREHEFLKSIGRAVPDVAAVDKWLNSPSYVSGRGGGFTTPIGGGTGTRSTALNSSAGFADSGFQSTVRGWLNVAFPGGDGGFIGIIDNLELLDTSSRAQQLMERLRDPVLQLAGLRWVLCGARGIARGVASTPRLNGVLADPIDVAPVPDVSIPPLLSSRVTTYAVSPDQMANAPVTATGFGYLYDVSHQNLRDSFSYAQDFATDHPAEFFLETAPPQIEERLIEWVDQLATRSAHDVRLQARMWRLLADLAAAGGAASPSDYAQFGFNDRTHMRKNVVELERYALAVSSRDETDQRRRSISLTSKGWLVHFAKKTHLVDQAAFDFDLGADE